MLKTYAPKARQDFIAAVTRRAAKFGLTTTGVSSVSDEGQLVIIEGQPYPKTIGALRRKLAERIKAQGFQQVMEAAAYTWFNRFAAIRFMELHGYLDHSFRVLSHPAGTALPEILEHAESVDLPGLDRDHVVELKMDGTRDEELYRDLLLAQCRALNQAMPFLFERVDDETELLLPDLLLQTDSLIRDLVTEIPEEDWQEIEIIGWLYQFYISEKKDQVIGKVVKSEDIPAATQLFTPNWIVKYMVQNSLGAQWLATYPQSSLKGQMEYYIEPAEQEEKEVDSEKWIVDREEGLTAIHYPLSTNQLDPESITLIDPACGSGHILVEAYELFKAIYLERGYRQRDVAKLILEKNLFGLDIDGRAAQLTGFALMMKGRADDRRLFERGVKLNVMALVDSGEVVSGEWLVDSGIAVDAGLADAVDKLVSVFEHAKTFGSLIQIPEKLAAKLPALKRLSEVTSQDLFVSEALKRLSPLVRQAELLAAQYDVVVANPPYMGSKGMNALVKKFAQNNFPDAKQDLFACFVERSYTLAKDAGRNAMVTMQNWMFLSSFQAMRERMLRQKTITTMAQIGYNSFPSMNSKIAQATVFSFANHRPVDFVGTFIDLNSAPQSADKRQVFLTRGPEIEFAIDSREFSKLPGSPVAYWTSDSVRTIYDEAKPLESFADIGKGLDTGDNESFLRLWFEPDRGSRWIPCLKGGPYRKWYGNHDYVIDWLDGGRTLRESPGSNLRNAHNYLRPGLTWTRVSSSLPAFRAFGDGFIFESTGPCIFSESLSQVELAAFLNSKLTPAFLRIVAPTLDFQSGHICGLPILSTNGSAAALQASAARCISTTRIDWDAYERSWDFQSFRLLSDEWRVTSDEKTELTTHHSSLATSYAAWITQNRDTITEMKHLEEENNRLFIDAYGLADELTPDVPIEQITLTVNPAYRYGNKVASGEWSVDSGFGEELEARFRQDTMKELVSYAIGCMMGRYRLDRPGLIYAHSGNERFWEIWEEEVDSDKWIVDREEATDQKEILSTNHYPLSTSSNLEDNLTFLANNLSPKKTESPRDTIRRYLCDSFFKDHLQTYKKRPIYWLFSSGKQKAFQCLVYLHRYNEGTLARMRMEYVVPLQSKMAARIDKLADDIQAASTSAQAKRLQKERDKRTRQLEELRRYDEQLRHYADLRIKLDLDDGVKVNYGKFGNLLTEVKAVTGKAPQ